MHTNEVPGLEPELLVLWLLNCAKEEERRVGEIAIVFCSDEYLYDMNLRYLNHDYYTDIITFDYSSGSEIGGDLYVSIDRVKDNAQVYNVDFIVELRRVCVHGLLHLCGYKDKEESEITIMRQKENTYLNRYVSRET